MPSIPYLNTIINQVPVPNVFFLHGRKMKSSWDIFLHSKKINTRELLSSFKIKTRQFCKTDPIYRVNVKGPSTHQLRSPLSVSAIQVWDVLALSKSWYLMWYFIFVPMWFKSKYIKDADFSLWVLWQLLNLEETQEVIIIILDSCCHNTLNPFVVPSCCFPYGPCSRWWYMDIWLAILSSPAEVSYIFCINNLY